MTNDELVGVKLTAVAVCTFAGWLCMCLGGFIFAVTDPQIWPKLVELSAALRSLSVLWWLATACLIAMTYVGSASFLFSTALWMPQHPRILAAAIIAVFAHLVAALSDGGNGWQWTSYWRLAAWVVAVAIISAGVYAIVNVVRLRALKPWILGSLVCLWLVYVGITLTLWNYTPTNGVTLPAAFAALGWALLTVPLSASVGAPLALASQRHLN